jgi:uncharacterized protein (TIGR03435 family)
MQNLQMLSTVAIVSIILNITALSTGAQTVQRQGGIGGMSSGKQLKFDAASLKPLVPLAPPVLTAPSGEEIISERVVRSTPGSSTSPGVVSPGRIHYVATLKEFLANAYDVKELQVEGPVWMATERFVLDATMPPETTREQRLSMLKNLLADRFKLTTHRDTKELPMYSLVVAKNGPKMKESPDVPVHTQSGADTSQPPSLATNVRTVTAGGRARITAQDETMQDLADHLTRQLDRPVKDETGMSRTYDFVLTFSSDGLSGTPNPAGTMPPTSSADGPPRSLSSDLPDAQELSDLFGAVQSQLGLKLEAKKGMVEVLVVDHCERMPTEN